MTCDARTEAGTPMLFADLCHGCSGWMAAGGVRRSSLAGALARSGWGGERAACGLRRRALSLNLPFGQPVALVALVLPESNYCALRRASIARELRDESSAELVEPFQGSCDLVGSPTPGCAEYREPGLTFALFRAKEGSILPARDGVLLFHQSPSNTSLACQKTTVHRSWVRRPSDDINRAS